VVPVRHVHVVPVRHVNVRDVDVVPVRHVNVRDMGVRAMPVVKVRAMAVVKVRAVSVVSMPAPPPPSAGDAGLDVFQASVIVHSIRVEDRVARPIRVGPPSETR